MALKDCFTNYITIEGLGVTPTSGLYANHLSGITIAQLGAVQKKQDENDLSDMWNNLYERSVHEFISDVTQRLGGKFHINKVQHQDETSDFLTSENTSNASSAGIRLWFSLSPYKEVKIGRVQLKALAAASNVDIVVRKDDSDGEILYTKTVASITEGTNTIDIYQDFRERRLFIGFDPTSVRAYETKDKTYYNYIADCNPIYDTSSHIEGGGLNVEISIVCSVERFICSRLDAIFKYPLLYKIGQMIAMERMVTDRVNRFTNMQREEADALYAYYKDRYDKEMDAVFIDFKDNTDPDCMVCRKPVWSSKMLP